MKRVLIFAIIFCVAASASAQRNPVFSSVDLRVATADRVFIGRIVAKNTPEGDADQNERHQEVTLLVVTPLKGDLPVRIQVRIEDDLWKSMDLAHLFCDTCNARTSRLLVMLQPDQQNLGGNEIINLDAPILDITGDLHIITNAAALLATVRDEIRRCPGVLPTRQYVAWGPSKTFLPGTPFHNTTIYVPFDDRQATLAKHVLATQPAPVGLSGEFDNDRPAAAYIIGHFHAQQNIPFMKTLLTDPQVVHAAVGRLDYPVRKMAYDSLVQCGATFNKPVLHIDITEPFNGKIPAVKAPAAQ